MWPASWTLRVELNGEWEECRYRTSLEALDAFAALRKDYKPLLTSVLLYPSRRTVPPLPRWSSGLRAQSYIN